MDSLDVNDSCKRPITNLKRRFVHGEFIQMHTIHESSYTIMNQLHNGNSETKEINKNSSVYRRSQAHLMGWMNLIIFTHIIHL